MTKKFLLKLDTYFIVSVFLGSLTLQLRCRWNISDSLSSKNN